MSYVPIAIYIIDYKPTLIPQSEETLANHTHSLQYDIWSHCGCTVSIIMSIFILIFLKFLTRTILSHN